MPGHLKRRGKPGPWKNRLGDRFPITCHVPKPCARGFLARGSGLRETSVSCLLDHPRHDPVVFPIAHRAAPRLTAGATGSSGPARNSKSKSTGNHSWYSNIVKRARRGICAEAVSRLKHMFGDNAKDPAAASRRLRDFMITNLVQQRLVHYCGRMRGYIGFGGGQDPAAARPS
jgi:hypothetical protein